MKQFIWDIYLSEENTSKLFFSPCRRPKETGARKIAPKTRHKIYSFEKELSSLY